ncbi:PEP-CTERM sorting domain-containing protein [Paraglaciecola psychrophila]|jgi:hypothetical protein|uniref:Ice-binding protein C-terminal domain-containing protein n=1 Tax=Paraglaciecola psychrophila 170 TaxID=1129794 RepID=K6Z641_9ALTE|nr:PEP-CTERM sorting domain-containing protein [Paraglaciecola psychrophila]AGH47441.1 hypothetical protein C427_5344 [Paraglaciecola psychrophila 170]GAC40554.1 hypothetical protein GPSY_4953 [Paraglaciecola psychrophila 170]
MSGRFFKVICAAVLSIGLIGQTNAGLITGLVQGQIYGDTLTTDLLWEYVGEFDLADAPDWLTNGNESHTPVNGLAAAVLAENYPELFGIQIAVAALGGTSNIDSTGNSVIVNHMAWYSRYANSLVTLAEDVTANNSGTTLFDDDGDVSAFVLDENIGAGTYVNYVFKAVEVPEPSTTAIFALALLGLGVRKLKR